MPSSKDEPIGILHPGAMGISVAASAQKSGRPVFWASAGRGKQTRARAESQDLLDAGTVKTLCLTCPVVISVCPPHAAEDVAQQVIDSGFSGLFVDANAISPQRTARIGALLSAADIDFVDGGIVGGPAWEPNRTWLYLSGEQAGAVADIFEAGPLETQIIGEEIGQASALKMCYAAWTKGSTALLSAILATATELGVQQELSAQWERNWPGFSEQTEERVRRVTAKAWRFAGEMDEIADTLDGAGLPDGFHRAAADLYQRMAHFKGASETPALEDVLAALIQKQ